MYTNDDLNEAIKKNIFSENSVEEFRKYISNTKNINVVDEEQFKLLTSFNDIFVVIAIALLLVSTQWIALSVNITFSYIITALIAWSLSEFFILKRKMSFPAIILLISFVISIFMSIYSYYGESLYNSSESFFIVIFSSTVAAYLHWKRFNVPISISIIMALITLLLSVSLFNNFPILKTYQSIIIFFIGILVFIVAMYWDIKDKKRITNDSDVAFWIHLLASPLIIHSIFLGLNIFDNNMNLFSILVVIFLYLILSIISLIIDRRALMVSSLVYVLYALNNLFNTYGFDGYGLAIGGVIIGIGLLFLTAFWKQTRTLLIKNISPYIKSKVPSI